MYEQSRYIPPWVEIKANRWKSDLVGGMIGILLDSMTLLILFKVAGGI